MAGKAPVVHEYEPWGAAKDLFHSKQGEVLLSGPAGTGKSRACLEKLHLLALNNPGARCLIVRKTRESLGSTALVTWREHVVKEALDAGIVWFYGGSAEHPPQYRYQNKSSVAIGGMDKSQKIMSSEYDAVFAQEAVELEEKDWEAITTRLRNGKISFQQLIADCNPDVPFHWLKQRCDRGAVSMLESRHEDNPILFNRDGTITERGSDYMGKLDALTGVRYLRLRKGLWVAAEGLVYEEFDPRVHAIDWFRPPDSWDRWWSVDFGYIHPFVCQMWAEDPDGRLYLYREVYHTKRTVDQHAKDILSAVADLPPNVDPDTARPSQWVWREPKPRAVVCDHDAENRAVLDRELGMGTIPATKGVTDGIQIVQKRLRDAGDGKPRMFLMRGAVVQRDRELVEAKRPTSTLEEMPGYVWDTGNGKKPKEQPLKEMDDGCDAMRYVAVERDRSRPRVRSMSGR